MMTIFEALADPTRRKILDLLRERPRLVGELTDLLQISQPGVSKQLRALREAGLVSIRVDAQRRWYQLETAPLAQVDAWLSKFRHQQEARFDRLEHLLDTLKNEENHDE